MRAPSLIAGLEVPVGFSVAWRVNRFAHGSRYNRNVKSSSIAAILLGLSLCWLAGCAKNIDSKEAVRQGVMNYLAKRSDLLVMDVSVTSVAFHQDEATATVHFQAKGISTPGAGMNMQYVLERKGNEWTVKGRAGSDASSNPHTGMPQGVPGGGAGSIGAMPNTGVPQTLPPGHPSVPNGRAPSGALPPGHPTVGSQPSNGSSK